MLLRYILTIDKYKRNFMTALEVAKKVLEIKKQPLNPNRIYKIADELDLTKELNLSGKTP